MIITDNNNGYLCRNPFRKKNSLLKNVWKRFNLKIVKLYVKIANLSLNSRKSISIDKTGQCETFLRLLNNNFLMSGDNQWLLLY